MASLRRRSERLNWNVWRWLAVKRADESVKRGESGRQGNWVDYGTSDDWFPPTMFQTSEDDGAISKCSTEMLHLFVLSLSQFTN